MKYLCLAGILLLGLVLRVIWLPSLPLGFNADEAAFGYNAYSLGLTGADEWGTSWYRLPFTNLRSFGDYKLPLYSFLAIPSIKLFGLSIFSTRLPNAIFGVFAILSVYLLAEVLFPASRVPFVSAFLLAISPWHIMLSRGAFEANLVTFFLPLGIYFFLGSKPIWSAIALALNFYAYHSGRLLTPIVLFLLLVFFPKIALKAKLAFVLLVLLLVPGAISLLGLGGARLSDVGIFHPTDNWQSVSDRRFAARNLGLPDSLSRLFSNKPLSLAALFVHNYLAYFSPQFLFVSGPAEATYGMITGRGVLYLFDLPFLLAFIYLYIKSPSRNLHFLVSLILIALLPAALAKGAGLAANRSEAVLPFLIIALAVGLTSLKKLLLPAVGLLYLVSLVFFLEDYIYHSPLITAPSMSFGWESLSQRLPPIAANFSDVRFSRSLSEPHILVAFFWKIPPLEYQKNSHDWATFASHLTFLDQHDGYYLHGYRFGDIHPQEKYDHPVLFIGRPGDFPDKFPQYFHVDYPTGQPAIQVSRSQ